MALLFLPVELQVSGAKALAARGELSGAAAALASFCIAKLILPLLYDVTPCRVTVIESSTNGLPSRRALWQGGGEMALRSRTEFPPRAGNFQYYQAETEWKSTPYTGFEPTVMEIQRHRQANKRFPFATDIPTIRAELDAFIEADLRAILGAQADAWIAGPPSTASPVPMFPPLRPRAGVGVGAAGSKVKAGIGLIASWLGDGLRPTDQATATKRAETCSVCPLNVHLEGIQKLVGTVGEFLHMVMSAKSDLKLSTPFDEKLFQCSACLCQNSVKIWVPAEHIRKSMTPEIKAALDPKCWQLPLLQ